MQSDLSYYLRNEKETTEKKNFKKPPQVSQNKLFSKEITIFFIRSFTILVVILKLSNTHCIKKTARIITPVNLKKKNNKIF